MHGLRTPILLTLTTLLLSLPTAAGSGVSDVGMSLEPGPDGTYALPLLDRHLPVPLEFDPGETPFRLVGLAFDPERGAIRATLRQVGTEPITAWAVELAAFTADVETLGSSTLTQDWYQSVDQDLSSRAAAQRLWPQEHEEGAFFPGQTQVVDLGLMAPVPKSSPRQLRFRLSVPVVVFGDTSFAGSPRLAREILGARAAAAEELAYWLVRLEGLLEGSGRDLSRALAGLGRELAAEVPNLAPAAQAIRANVLQNLPDAVQTKRLEGSLEAELESLSSWLRTELQKDLRHVPAELPAGPAQAPRGPGLEEKIGEDGGTGSEEENCECGGELLASVTRSEFPVCNSSSGWKVNESWSFTCRDADGRTMGASGTGSLNGVGGCLRNYLCYPDIDCPPTFVGPSVYDDDNEHVWSRSVTNAGVALGACTARCTIVIGSSLTHRCMCMPKPAPSCDIDGCPVLIETGAGGFRLTDLDRGVAFDIDADGSAERVSWPVADTDDAWLALDRDGNGSIDDGGELFGDATPQPPSAEPNGFLALAVFDRPENGGNGDGQISAADAVFSELRLWLDRDHNGRSEPSELSGLEAAGIVALELEYRSARRRDRYGNEFRYSAGVWYASGARRPAVDVFLLYE